MVKKAPIFVALDTPNLNKAITIANDIKSFVTGIKVGPIFFSKNSIDKVYKFSEMNLRVFVDNKIHDLESIVLKSVASLNSECIDYYTIHTANGLKTLSKAKEVCVGMSRPIKLLGVTVLTSFDDSNLKEIGIKNKMEEQIKQLASLAQESKLDGVICDGKNIKSVKNVFKGELFVPGVRLNRDKMHDQNPSRSITPKEALDHGATFLVCGREIIEGNPKENIQKIINSLK